MADLLGNEYFFPLIPDRLRESYKDILNNDDDDIIVDVDDNIVDEDDYFDELELEENDARAKQNDDFRRILDSMTSEEPEYKSDVIENLESLSSVSLSMYDVIMALLLPDKETDFLLRVKNGERVYYNSLVNSNTKYIMLCCFFVPAICYDINAYLVRCLSNTCAQLYDSRSEDFELVVAAKMRSGWETNEDAFMQFLSGFPQDTLVVPFSNSISSDSICMFLELSSSTPRGVLIDVDNKDILWHRDLPFFQDYGPYGFPYTDDALEAIHAQDSKVPLESMTLEQLVSSNSNSDTELVLSNGVGRVINVSQLKDRYVVLYLYLSSSIHRKLLMVQKQCIDAGMNFEVIVAFPPIGYIDNYGFFERLIEDDALADLHKSWWLLPTENSLRLLRICKNYAFFGDRLIAVGPRDSFLDTHVEDVVRCLGVRGYPFSRVVIVDRFVEQLRTLTLHSVLGSYVESTQERSPFTKLHGRNVVLCVFANRTSFPDNHAYRTLIKWYEQLKEKDGDFEVVIVLLAQGFDNLQQQQLKTMPWWVCRCDPVHASSVADKVFLKGKSNTLIAFGKDGKIDSMRAQQLLTYYGIDAAFPFKGNLHSVLLALCGLLVPTTSRDLSHLVVIINSSPLIVFRLSPKVL